MYKSGPFHGGEHVVQNALNVFDEADSRGRFMIKGAIPEVKVPYLNSLTYIVVASIDHEESQTSSWSSILFGEEGFVTVSNDGRHVHVNNARMANLSLDPLFANLQKCGKSAVSIMAIDFEVRNRYRINGHVVTMTSKDNLFSFTLKVEEAFGNCPKYIHAHHTDGSLPDFERSSDVPQSTNHITYQLSAETASLISTCDTMFMSTYHVHPTSSNKVRDTMTDITHRGGSPGFVRVVSRSQLTWPDYSGNNMYITLGNLAASGGTGLLFVDFKNERYLQVTGTATVHISTEGGVSQQLTLNDQGTEQIHQHNHTMDGSNRYVVFTIKEVRAVQKLPPGYFDHMDSSPYNPQLSGFRGNLSSIVFDSEDGTQSVLSATQDDDQPNELTLSSATFLSSQVAQFRFSLSCPYNNTQFFPGQYATVLIQLPFTNNDNPIYDPFRVSVVGSEGDNVHRSWTVTAVVEEEVVVGDSMKNRSITCIEFTIKVNTTDGYISPWLHNLARTSQLMTVSGGGDSVDTGDMWRTLQQQYGLSFVLKGISGDFSIYNTHHKLPTQGKKRGGGENAVKSLSVLERSVVECSGKILLLSGGIGITPFLTTIHSLFHPKYQQMLADSVTSDVVSRVSALDVILVATFRSAEEAGCVNQLLGYVNNQQRGSVSGVKVNLTVHVVITSPFPDNAIQQPESTLNNPHIHTTYGSRLTTDYLTTHLPALTQFDCYLCGPDVFMHTIGEGLVVRFGVDPNHVHMEEFYF